MVKSGFMWFKLVLMWLKVVLCGSNWLYVVEGGCIWLRVVVCGKRWFYGGLNPVRTGINVGIIGLCGLMLLFGCAPPPSPSPSPKDNT